MLTTIDVQQTLKAKLDRDFRKYVILGACNPALADRALHAELEIGLLLPCNVIVYETAGNQSVVAAMAPLVALGIVGANPALHDVATGSGRTPAAGAGRAGGHQMKNRRNGRTSHVDRTRRPGRMDRPAGVGVAATGRPDVSGPSAARAAAIEIHSGRR